MLEEYRGVAQGAGTRRFAASARARRPRADHPRLRPPKWCSNRDTAARHGARRVTRRYPCPEPDVRRRPRAPAGSLTRQKHYTILPGPGLDRGNLRDFLGRIAGADTSALIDPAPSGILAATKGEGYGTAHVASVDQFFRCRCQRRARTISCDLSLVCARLADRRDRNRTRRRRHRDGPGADTGGRRHRRHHLEAGAAHPEARSALQRLRSG
jgi:hypothetical protein